MTAYMFFIQSFNANGYFYTNDLQYEIPNQQA